jgi:uncharacterized protein (UPF0305 family)
MFNFSAIHSVEILSSERVDNLSKNCRMALMSALVDTLVEVAKTGNIEEINKVATRKSRLDALESKLQADSSYREDDEKALTVAQLQLSVLPKYKCSFDKLPLTRRYQLLEEYVKDLNAKEKAAK